MANYIGAKLSRLIKQRAYDSGEVERLSEIEVKLTAVISKARAGLRAAKNNSQALQERIRRTDEEIQLLSVMNPVEIRKIRAMPRKMNGKHGDFRRELIKVLKNAGGALNIGEMVAYMAKRFDIPMVTTQDRVRARYLVRRQLNIFKKRGAVERLPSLPENNHGVWRWIVGQAESDA